MLGRVQFRIFFFLLTLVILGLAIGSLIYMFEKVEKPTQMTFDQIQSAPPPAPIDPGLGEFDTAMELLKNRQFLAARDRLRYIIKYFKKSTRYPDARRICGEINLDLALSPQHKPGKTVYEVKPGDSMNKIVAEQKTTKEFINRSNLLISTQLRPGDLLTIKPLDFAITASMGKSLLTLTEAGEFFKEYPIAKIVLPKGASAPYTDSVRMVSATLDGTSIEPSALGYDQADKHIQLKRRGMSLLPLPKPQTNGEAKSEAAENAPGVTGIFIDPADLDELCFLLRPDTPFTLAP